MAQNTGIARIEFGAGKGNSLGIKELRDLAQEITVAGKDSEIKLIVLSSKGEGAFCAGGNFEEMKALKDFNSAKEFFLGFAKVMQAMIAAPKFVLTRVQGKAVGGGVGIISASNYVIASDAAAIRLSELSIGIGPFVISPVVKFKLGEANFANLAIDAEWRDARWCLEKGLYAGVCEAKDLEGEILKASNKLSLYSPEAAAQVKKNIWEGMDFSTERFAKLAEENARLVEAGGLVVV